MGPQELIINQMMNELPHQRASLVLVGCELQEMTKFRFHAPRAGPHWAQWWLCPSMGSMWEGQLAPALPLQLRPNVTSDFNHDM